MSQIQYTFFKMVGVSLTAINDVQSLNITEGRVSVQDPFRTGVAILEGINPQNLPIIEIGNTVIIYGKDGATDEFQYIGTVANFQIDYGIVENLDRWTIELEDSLANAGRLNTNTSWSSGSTTYQAAQALATSAGLTISAPLTPAGSSLVSAQTITNGNVLSVLQQLIMTEQGRIYSINNNNITWIGRGAITNKTPYAEFNDGTLSPTVFISQLKYDGVQFASLADNYATKVVVTPEGLAPQTAGSGTRSFEVSSYDQTTSQATDLAGFVQSTLKEATDVPYSVTCLLSQQSNFETFSVLNASSVAGFVNVVLRGTRYVCVVNGWSMSATPEDTRFTYNLSAASVYQFFILNDTFFGILDKGKLGF